MATNFNIQGAGQQPQPQQPSPQQGNAQLQQPQQRQLISAEGSELVKGFLAFLQNNGVNLDAVEVQSDADTSSIIFADADSLGNNFLIIITIENNDKSWSVIVKKPIELSVMNRPRVFEYLNSLNSTSFMTTAFLIEEGEPGLVLRIDRESSDLTDLIADSKTAMTLAQDQFNVRF